MDDSILTPEEKSILEDPTIPDEEKYALIDRAIYRAAI